ncbi:MAG: nucleotidyltransferase family protein [Gemmatimonadaceae bacterium]
MRAAATRAAAARDATDSRIVEWTAALALGIAPASAPPEWELLFHFTVRERCAAAAWLRSAALIRALAPAIVAEQWRRYTHSSCVAGCAQLTDAAEIAALAQTLGIFPVVLKGAPLALKLYGDAGARCSDDVDLFVRREYRDAFAGLVGELGWRLLWGNRDGDENFVRERSGTHSYVEVHSSLLQARRSPCSFAPDSRTLRHGDGALLAQDGLSELPYLAFNAAKHRHPPLGRFLDLLMYWDGLGEPVRHATSAAARQLGLSRYLEWALHRSHLLERAARGDRTAVAAMGYRGTGHRDAHPAWRHIGLSGSYRDAVRFVGSYVVPPWQRTAYGAGLSGSLRRLSTRARRGSWTRAARSWRDLLPRWQERRLSGEAK